MKLLQAKPLLSLQKDQGGVGEMTECFLWGDVSYFNGWLLAVGAGNFSIPSQLCSLLSCRALPAAVGKPCWTGAAGGFRQGLSKALLREECLVSQVWSVLKLCMETLSS